MASHRTETAEGLAGTLASLLGGEPVAIRAYDGSSAGPPDAPATLDIRSPDALRRVLASPGELGMVRAYVAGDIELEGDIYAALAAVRGRLGDAFRGPRTWATLARLVRRGRWAAPATRRRPRRRSGCTDVGTAVRGTPRRSPTTTTSRATSTGCSSARR